MIISAKDKVSSFLQILQQVSLIHQLTQLQHEVEILAGQEARLVEIAERTLRLVSSRQEQLEVSATSDIFPGQNLQTIV